MIQLKRSISVKCFESQATVAVGRQRPEFLAIAQLAADFGRPINAQDIHHELLRNCPETMGRLVLKRSVDLGLLEDVEQEGYAQLSSAGKQALQVGQVLVPEEGVWRFYLTNDPLMPHHLLHAHRLETDSAHKSRDNNRKNTEQSGSQRAFPLPQLLKACKNGKAGPSIVDGQFQQIRELPSHGIKAHDCTLELSYEWTPHGPPLIKLTGELKGIGKKDKQQIDASLAPETKVADSYEQLWKLLAAFASQVDIAELDQWHERTARLILPAMLADLSFIERKQFTRELTIPEWKRGYIGTFNSTVLSAVPLVPASETDADEWAKWLQWDAIQDYVTPAHLDQMGNAVRSQFLYHDPQLATPNELLARALHGERDTHSPYLLAPYDLGLWS